jgi:hypothetical protein
VRTVVQFRGRRYSCHTAGKSLGELRPLLQNLAAGAQQEQQQQEEEGGGEGGDGAAPPRWVSADEIDQIQHPPQPTDNRGDGGGGGGGGRGRGERQQQAAAEAAAQVATPAGVIAGATDTGYVASGANSGAAGGERVPLPSHPTRRPGQRVGPAQQPVVDALPAVSATVNARSADKNAPLN